MEANIVPTSLNDKNELSINCVSPNFSKFENRANERYELISRAIDPSGKLEKKKEYIESYLLHNGFDGMTKTQAFALALIQFSELDIELQPGYICLLPKRVNGKTIDTIYITAIGCRAILRTSGYKKVIDKPAVIQIERDQYGNEFAYIQLVVCFEKDGIKTEELGCAEGQIKSVNNSTVYTRSQIIMKAETAAVNRFAKSITGLHTDDFAEDYPRGQHPKSITIEDIN